MKAKNLSLSFAACAFALVACKPKAQTTEAGVDKVKEGINQIVGPGLNL